MFLQDLYRLIGFLFLLQYALYIVLGEDFEFTNVSVQKMPRHIIVHCFVEHDFSVYIIVFPG